MKGRGFDYTLKYRFLPVTKHPCTEHKLRSFIPRGRVDDFWGYLMVVWP